MPTTPILGITQVSTSQNGKETTINDAILALENATNAKLVVSLAAGNVTLTATEATRNFIFEAQAATAAAEILFPTAVNGNPYNRVIVVRNTSGHGLTVRFASGSGSTVTIPNGESRLISAEDGVDMLVAAEPPSVISFLSLTDAPETYTGQTGRFLSVNEAENALEFVDGATFPTLTGNANKFLMVNGGATGVVWATPDFAATFTELTDTPATYSGQAGKFVRVNAAATGLEFITPDETEAVSYVEATRWRILALEPGVWPENPPGLDPSDPDYITPTEQVGFGEIEFLNQDDIDLTGTGTASASNFRSGNEPDRAFNNVTTSGDGWLTEATYSGEVWIEYTFPTAVAPRKVRLTSIGGSPQYGPMRFLIQYWDGSAWISLGDRTPALWETDVPQTFRINGVPLDVLSEAPTDGSLYGRINESWLKINAEVVAVSTTNYNLDATHVFQYRRFTNTGTKTLNIRTEAVHPMPADGEWYIYNAAGAALTIVPAAGVTVNAPAGGSLIVPLNGTVRIKRVAANSYDVFGDTVSSEGAGAGDIPSLLGNANRLLAVKSDETGMEWIPPATPYTDEQARDAVAAALVAGTNVTITHNDAANTITIDAASIGLNAEEVRDTIGNALRAGTNISLTINDAADTITISTTGLDAEGVRDTVAAALVSGSNISINHNDSANTITIAASMDEEVIRDTVAASLVAGSNVIITHDDVANTITISSTGGGSGGGGLDAETVRDVVAAALTPGPNVTITYNDAADTITIDATTDPEVVRDTIGSALVAGANITITPNDGSNTITVAAAMDQEVIRDTIAAALVAGTNVTITHNDAANTITIDAAGAGTDPEIVRDTMAAALVAGSNVTITPNDLGDTITIAAAGTDPEIVRDTIGSALVAGTNVTINVNDAANTITISAAGTDPEVVRDTMGSALTAGPGISITPNDAGDTITISAVIDAESIRDLVGATLIAGAGISIDVNDAADAITISAAAGGGLDAEGVRDTIGTTLVAGSNITIDVDDASDTITISSTGGGGGSGSGAFVRPTVVQRVSAAGNSASVTLPNPPTPGNTLVVIASHYNNVAANEIASGWTTILNTNGAVTDGNIIVAKVVNGNDGASFTPFTVTSGCCITVFEIANASGTVVLPHVSIQGQTGLTTTTLRVGVPNDLCLIVGNVLTVQSNTLPISIGGATAGASVTGTSAAASPRQVTSFVVEAPAKGERTVVATYTGTPRQSGMAVVLLPGFTGETFGGAALPYSLPLGFTAGPTSSETLLISVFSETVQFSSNFEGSRGIVQNNPLATFVLSVRKNGIEVGSISISSTGIVTLSTVSGLPVEFEPGDVLTVVAPSSVDLAISNCAISLLGYRSA